jgi:hypothetical protein
MWVVRGCGWDLCRSMMDMVEGDRKVRVVGVRKRR